MSNQQKDFQKGYESAVFEIEQICDDLCYCKSREGSFYSKTKYGKQMCAFCWLKHRIREECKF